MSAQIERASFQDAVNQWYADLDEIGILEPLEVERQRLNQVLNRITAQDLVAERAVPHYRGAAMDGYGVCAADTATATLNQPVSLSLEHQATPVDTGHPLPDQFDAVIKLEDVEHGLALEGKPTTIQVSQPIAAGKHVRQIGEDVELGQMVIPAGHRLRPQDLGVLAACGQTHIPVYRRPKIAIIPTGPELRRAGGQLLPGEIPEFNSYILEGQAQLAGCEARTWPMMVHDDYWELRETVRRALFGNDLVIINAGSSRGSSDYTAHVVADLGRISVQGIALRPGHPTILGIHAERQAAIVGLPGYPVATFLVFDRLIAPLLYRWQGLPTPQRTTIQAHLTEPVLSSVSEDSFIPVKLEQQEGCEYQATPLHKGAGILTSLVNGQGLLTVPRGCEGYAAGEIVTVELFSNKV